MQFLNPFNPDKPFSDSAVMDALRSSVGTVDHSEFMGMSQGTLQMPTEDDWMRLSATNDGPARRSSLAMSNNSVPIVAHQDIEEIVDAYMQDTSRPYGVFSSSTKSNPFAASLSNGSGSPKRASILASSITSANNPLLMSSTRSSFMDMDMDGLLDSMDSMSMMNTLVEEL